MKLNIALMGLLLAHNTTSFAMRRVCSALPKTTVLARSLTQLPKYENRIEIIECKASTAQSKKNEMQDLITQANNQGWELTDVRLSTTSVNLICFWVLQFKRECEEKPAKLVF